MNPGRKLVVGWLGLAALGLAGCGGGPQFARVSGVVTFDGKPMKNAVVSFQPIGSRDNPNPGRGSNSLTDAEGRYFLMTDKPVNGAVVGKHLVRIFSAWDSKADGFVIDPNLGSPDGVPAGKPRRKSVIDVIPPEWNAESMIVFEVPADGTDQANFNIVSRKKR